MNHFIGGKSGGSIYYKPIQCPTGYIMTGTRMYVLVMVLMRNMSMPTVAPLIKLQHQED
ncbi:shufflon protein C' domain protein (plasmid) [Shigella sonnei]|nr:shufflon protein C' domain protein [Shigella sonnei]